MTDTLDRDEVVKIRALLNQDMWDDCEHEGSGRTDHSCPRCGGTLRRCCDSIVGAHPHQEDCGEPRGEERD